MNGSEPPVEGGRGQRAGDIEVRTPRVIPANPVTKMLLGAAGHSRDRAPAGLIRLGFSRLEFYEQAGGTCVVLRKSNKSEPTPWFSKDMGNIATVLVHLTEYPELSVFDTPRGRIGATRLVASTSLDDPDSPASRAVKAVPVIGTIASLAANMPPIGGVITGAFPWLVDEARKLHGRSTDYSIRTAQMGVQLTGRRAFFIRTGRSDREFDPPLWSRYNRPVERLRYVSEMLGTVGRDIDAAWKEFAVTEEFTGLSAGGQLRTQWLVEGAWHSLCRWSLEAFEQGLTWPLALRLLALDDGAAQFVRHVATGRQP